MPGFSAIDLILRVTHDLSQAAMRAAPAWVGALWGLVVARVILVAKINDINILRPCKKRLPSGRQALPGVSAGREWGRGSCQKAGVERVLQRPNERGGMRDIGECASPAGRADAGPGRLQRLLTGLGQTLTFPSGQLRSCSLTQNRLTKMAFGITAWRSILSRVQRRELPPVCAVWTARPPGSAWPGSNAGACDWLILIRCAAHSISFRRAA